MDTLPGTDRPPCPPSWAGTETMIVDELRFTYTVGREYIKDPLRELLMSREPLAVDIETEGLGAAALNIKSVTFGTTTAAVICDPRDPYQRDLIIKSLAYARELLFWNSSFDVPNMARNGLMGTDECAKVTDGVLYARLANPDERTSKRLSDTWERYQHGTIGTGKGNDENRAMFQIMRVRKVDGFKVIDLNMPIFVQAAALDVVRTAVLTPIARKRAFNQLTRGHPYENRGVHGQEAWDLVEREQRLNRMFLRRSIRGLRVDFAFLDAYKERNAAQIDADTDVLLAHDIKPTNANTLFVALENAGALPADHPRTKTGKYQATAAVLEAMRHELAQTYVRRKKLVKVDEDYLSKVRDLASAAGRIHPDTKLLAAVTGRMSMGTPPLHQFPEAARGMVLADLGDELTSIDWSQIEPVIAANLAGEQRIIAAYEDPTIKADVYTPVAHAAHIERKPAKTVLLGLLYGLGVAKLSLDLGCDEDEAYDLRNTVFEAMPSIARWTRGLRRLAERHQKVITLSGRILPIPRGRYRPDEPETVHTHKGINYTVQGSAYDLLADSTLACEDAGYGDAIYLAMHDELVVSTSASRDIRKIMEEPSARLCELSGRVPVLRTDLLDLGERWAVA